jgi:hypothetical protein
MGMVLCFNGLDDMTREELLDTFHFQDSKFSEGFKYLSCMLKPNAYK